MEKLLKKFKEICHLSPVDAVISLDRSAECSDMLDLEVTGDSDLFKAIVSVKVYNDVSKFTSEGFNTVDDAVESVSRKVYEYFEQLLGKSNTTVAMSPIPTPRNETEEKLQLVQEDYFEQNLESQLFLHANQLVTLVNLYNSVYDPKKTRSCIAEETINQMPNAFKFTTKKLKNYFEATVSAYNCRQFVGRSPRNEIKATNNAVHSQFVYIQNLSRFFAFFSMINKPGRKAKAVFDELFAWDEFHSFSAERLIRLNVYEPRPFYNQPNFEVSLIIQDLINVQTLEVEKTFALNQTAIKVVNAIALLAPVVRRSPKMTDQVIFGRYAPKIENANKETRMVQQQKPNENDIVNNGFHPMIENVSTTKPELSSIAFQAFASEASFADPLLQTPSSLSLQKSNFNGEKEKEIIEQGLKANENAFYSQSLQASTSTAMPAADSERGDNLTLYPTLLSPLPLAVCSHDKKKTIITSAQPPPSLPKANAFKHLQFEKQQPKKSSVKFLFARSERIVKLLNLFASVYLPEKSKLAVMEELLAKKGCIGALGDDYLLKVKTTMPSDYGQEYFTTVDSEDLGRFYGIAKTDLESKHEALLKVYDVLERLTTLLTDFVKLSSTSSSSSELLLRLLAKHSPVTANLQVFRKYEGQNIKNNSSPVTYQAVLNIHQLHYFNETATSNEQATADVCDTAADYLRLICDHLTCKFD